MSIRKSRFFAIVLLTLSLLGGVAGRASAQISNGSFESGNLSGWSSTGDVSILGNTLGISPTNGSFHALLASGTDGTVNGSVPAGTGVIQNYLETFFNISAGGLSSVVTGENVVIGSGISQSIFILKGQTLSYDWDFLTNQTYQDGGAHPIAPTVKNNDYAFVAVAAPGAGNSTPTKLADTFLGYDGSTNPFSSGFNITGVSNPFISHSGYSTGTFTAAATGSHLIGFGVAHATTADESTTHDNGVNSALLIDNVRLSTPILSVSIQNSPVTGGTSDTGIITFLNPAPSATSYTVSSSNSAASGPVGAQTVNTGDTGEQFTITTNAVDTAQTVTITVDWQNAENLATMVVNPPVLSGLQYNSSTVVGGNQIVVTVNLSGPAGPSGLTASITSDNADAQVPPTVPISAGNSSAQFSIVTKGVDTTEGANVQVTVGATTDPIAVTINPATLTKLVVSPSTTVGGNVLPAGVYLNGRAGPSGVAVSVSSDNTSAASVPLIVNISAQTVVGAFKVTTYPVSSQQTANITAASGPLNAAAQVTVNAPNLVQFTITKSSVVGGATVGGFVLLYVAAPVGGISISIGSDNAAAQPPASVTIAGGTRYTSFSIPTQGVSTTQVANLSATLGSTTLNQALTLTAASLLKVVVSPTILIGGQVGSGGVYFNGKVSALTNVTLQSDNVALSVPASVNVAANSSVATFKAIAQPVDSSQTVNVSATFGSATVQTTVTVNPAVLVSIKVSPSSVAGGNKSALLLTLNGKAGPSGVSVSLSSDNALAQVPASVVIPSSKTYLWVSVTTSSNTTGSPVIANISANSGAFTTQLTIN